MKQITPIAARKTLLSIIASMQQDPAPFVKDPRKDFTRNRSLPFTDVVLYTMTCQAHSLSKDMYNYYAPMKRKSVPTKSAFTQQRNKINGNAFPFILSQFNELCPVYKKLKDIYIFGIDGSDINIPADKNDCATFIPYPSKNGGYHQLHINVLYDLLNSRYNDLLIQPRAEINEVSAACEMVDRNTIKEKCLYICDRGYEAFNLMAHIAEKDHYFLIRAKDISASNSSYHSLNLPSSGEFDVDINFSLTRSQKKQDKSQPQRKFLPTGCHFDFIAPDDKESVYPLSYRLIKIELEEGAYEYLLTNLPREVFGLSEMKDLYHLRWKVETSFLFLKYGICLNYFHSYKNENLYQEIYAKIILYNFIAYIINRVTVPRKDTKYEYKLSFSDAIYLCRDFLVTRKTWKFVRSELLRHLTPIRPDRTYPRKVVSQRLKPLQHRS